MTRTAALLFALALAPADLGCKKDQAESRPARVGRTNVPAADPRLPAPHPLAAEPEAAVYLANPAALVAAAGAYMPAPPSLQAVAEWLLGTQGPADFAALVAGQLDGTRPWAGAHVAGEDIVYVPLTPAGTTKVAEFLRSYPAKGKFGAVSVPAPAWTPGSGAPRSGGTGVSGVRLAWVDQASNTLTLASTPEGLATGRELAIKYKAAPVWAVLGQARGQAWLGKFPYARTEVKGAGLHQLTVTAQATPGQALPLPRELAPGSLTGALQAAPLAVGVSSRWSGYRDGVRQVINGMQAGVNRAGFAAKMMLDPIVNQATRTLKHWNGRVLVGVGPARHIRLGFGADDPHAAHRTLLTLLRDIIDNLQLARMFVANIPNASLKKTASSPDIWLLTVNGISQNLPPDLRTITENGRLSVAFNGNAHGGGVFFVAGPKADSELKTWLDVIAKATPGRSSNDDLVAATLAVSPKALGPLLSAGPSEKLLPLVLGLSADREPTQVVVKLQSNGNRIEAELSGPALKP